VNAQPATARRIGVGLLAAASLLLTSCAAGRHAQTAQQVPAIDGTNGSVGSIQLSAVAIAAPSGAVSYSAGTSAEIKLVIVNNGADADILTGVSTPVTQGWAVFPDAAAASAAASASGSASASASAPPSGSASGSASATESASASTSASTQAGATSVDIPAGQAVSLGVGSSPKGVLLLLGVTKTLYPAQSVQISFTFAKAGSVTLTVPVQTGDNPASSTVPAGTAAE
jgi:copper(I)-binding protein